MREVVFAELSQKDLEEIKALEARIQKNNGPEEIYLLAVKKR